MNYCRKGQLNLGQLISLLDGRPQDQSIRFDFGGNIVPDGLGSYRGDYADLAIGYKDWGRNISPVKVGDVLKELKSAIGKTFDGYKGGDYVMSESTPLWAANYGECGSTAVKGLCKCNYETIIKTKWVEF